jgi:hypothetical protein
MRIAINLATSQIANNLILAFAKEECHELVLLAHKPEVFCTQ